MEKVSEFPTLSAKVSDEYIFPSNWKSIRHEIPFYQQYIDCRMAGNIILNAKKARYDCSEECRHRYHGQGCIQRAAALLQICNETFHLAQIWPKHRVEQGMERQTVTS